MKIRRSISLLLIAVLLLAAIPLEAHAAGVAVNNTNFPDANFRAYISETFDKDGNGILSESEIADAEDIGVPKKSISSVKGVEFFTELKYLSCNDNEINDLDVSKNTHLRWLVIDNNNIKTLNLTKNTSLELLSSSFNPITSLKLPRTDTLRTLWIERIPSLSYVDVSPCSRIVYAYNNAERSSFCDFYKYEIDDVKFQINKTATVYSGAEKPIVTSQPSSVTVAENGTAVFKVSAMGATSYQWQYRAPSGSWTTVKNGGTAATYKLTVAARHNGYKYRCRIRNANGTSYSNNVTLTVRLSPPTITEQPKDCTVFVGKTAVFALKATGAASYQWYYRKPGDSSWTAVTKNGTAAKYTLATEARHNGYKYRCRIRNSEGEVYSSTVALTVSLKPVITVQPKNVSVAVGKTAVFSVKADGASSYRWYYRTSETGSWTAVSAASGRTAEYSLTAAARHNGYQYRCKITNSDGYVFSKTVKLTLK